MSTILDRIIAEKRRLLPLAKEALPLAALEVQAADAPPPRDFLAALAGDGPLPRPRVIAEIKRRSPTAGEIKPNANVVEVAQQYMLAGAAALSVLTDEKFFGGSIEDLAAARAGTRLPVLRKDFLLEAYDVWRARAAGADAVLLIAAVLAPSELATMRALAEQLGMTALVEVHAESELKAALDAGARLIGVNHRDLSTFEMDMTLAARLRPKMAGVTVVAESGIKTAADVARMRDAGIDAVLVGEALMRQPDPGAALRELIRGCS